MRHAPAKLTLISHRLCPYVQRVAIALAEKSAAFHARRCRSRRQTGLVPCDLSARQDARAQGRRRRDLRERGDPRISGGNALAADAPGRPARRADHRAWIEVSSSILNDIAGFYASVDAGGLRREEQGSRGKVWSRRGSPVGRPVFRRATIFAGGRRLRTCLSLFRRLRHDRGLRDSGRQAEDGKMATGVARAPVSPSCGRPRLCRASARVLARAQIAAFAAHANSRLKRRRADPMRPKIAQARRPCPVDANPKKKRERDRPQKHQKRAERVAEAPDDPAPASRLRLLGRPERRRSRAGRRKVQGARARSGDRPSRRPIRLRRGC